MGYNFSVVMVDWLPLFLAWMRVIGHYFWWCKMLTKVHAEPKRSLFSVGLNILSLSWGWYCLIVTCYIFAWGVFPLLRSVCARVRVYVLLVVTCTVDVVPSHPVSQLFFKPLLTFMNNGSIGLLYFEKTATVSQLMIYTSQSKMLYYL